MAQTANTNSCLLVQASAQMFYITDGSCPNLNMTSAMTIETWVKPTTITAGDVLVSKWYTSGTGGFRLDVGATGSRIKFSVRNGSSTHTDTATGTALSVGRWDHVAVTWDDSVDELGFYFNGVFIKAKSVSSGMTASPNSFMVGATDLGGGSDGQNHFDGRLDDVRVWNTVRTAKQIADNYSRELVGNESGLVGYWKFNDAATDSTSNSYNLNAKNSAGYSSPKEPAFWGRPGSTGGGSRTYGSYGY